MENLNSVLIVAITRLGDMLQASPMLSGLKRRHPECKITVLVEKQFASICDGIPGIDEVYIIDLGMIHRALCRDYHNVVDAYKYFDQIICDLKARNFDMCLNMSSSGYTAIVLKLLGIEDSRGWVSDEEGFRLISNPWSMLFAAFVYHNNRDYNSINIVDIFRCSAGVKEHPLKLMYEPKEEDREFVKPFLEEQGIGQGGPLVALQVGASQEKRQWAPARFARLAQLLTEQYGARLLFTGTSSEAAIIEEVFSFYHVPTMVSAAGKTNLGQLSGLLEEAQVLITGDTGPMHLSVAVNTPVVALFLASALCYETGPYSRGNLIIEPQVTCYPCNPNYPCRRPDCHDQITPELVAYLVGRRMELDNEQLEAMHIPAETAPPQEVGVYATVFDDNKFLDFKRVNGSAQKEGLPFEFYRAARDSYRVLWQEEFGAVERASVWDLVDESASGIELIPGLARAADLARQGIDEIDQLTKLIADPLGSPHLLGEANQRIENIDRSIEEIGLAQAVLGAVTRMFVMEKQNIRGQDATAIAADTRELYHRLERRCTKFGRLFDYYYRNSTAAASSSAEQNTGLRG